METQELKKLQAPLKQKYKDHPQSAMITLSSKAKIGEGITCRIETGKALVACAGVTLSAVSTAIGVTLRDATISAEGDLDFRGTLAVDKATPVGFQGIRLNFDLDTDATPEQITSLLKLTERYCVVYQSLVNAPAISIFSSS